MKQELVILIFTYYQTHTIEQSSFQQNDILFKKLVNPNFYIY